MASSVTDRQLLIANLVEKLTALDAAVDQVPRVVDDVGDADGPRLVAKTQHSSSSGSFTTQRNAFSSTYTYTQKHFTVG